MNLAEALLAVAEEFKSTYLVDNEWEVRSTSKILTVVEYPGIPPTSGNAYYKTHHASTKWTLFRNRGDSSSGVPSRLGTLELADDKAPKSEVIGFAPESGLDFRTAFRIFKALGLEPK